MSKKAIAPSQVFLTNPLVKDNHKQPFANDYSGKLEGFAKNLTAFIEGKAKNKPLVISLSAPYGMGKTTFIDMWGQWLTNEGKIAIKYDAWQEDYCENALLSILATINEQLKFFVKDSKIVSDIKKAGFKLGVKCLPAIIKFIVSAGAEYIGISESFAKLMKDLSGLADLEKASELVAKVKKETKKEITDFVLKEIDSHKSKAESVSGFKSAMRSIFADGTHKTLFFFVDELDRCKPVFALSIIESIKHFFDVENVCFILVSNQKVLFDMFRKTYGHSFESEDYFERFIDRHITLPTPELDRFTDYQIEQLPVIRDCKDEDKLFRHVIYSCCKNFRFNLREVLKYLDNIVDFIITNDGFGKRVPSIYLPAIAYLLALKRKKSHIYSEVIKTKKFPDELEISEDEKIKIWPIENLDEGEKDILYWLIKFLLASNDKEALSRVAHALRGAIGDIQNKQSNGGLRQQEYAYYLSLTTLEKNLTNYVYGDFIQPAIRGKDTYDDGGKDRAYVKKHTNHLEFSIQIIDFLTPEEVNDATL